MTTTQTATSINISAVLEVARIDKRNAVAAWDNFAEAAELFYVKTGHKNELLDARHLEAKTAYKVAARAYREALEAEAATR